MNQSHVAQRGRPSGVAVAGRVIALFALLTFSISCATGPVRDEPGVPAETTPDDSGTPAGRGKDGDDGLPAESGLWAETDLPAKSGASGKTGAPTESEAKGAVVANAPAQTATVAALRAEGEVRLLPEQGPGFWETMMTPEVAWEYRAINGVSQCTRFVADMLDLYFGHDAYEQVFPAGVNGANETFFEWVENHDLVRLPPEEYSIREIQDLANQGYLILMAYYFPDIAGHVAFVGHKELKLFTIPALGGLEGKNGASLGRRWLPVMVQAGTYTGITSMVYATNGWLRNDNFGQGIVRYYFVRSGAELPADIQLEQ